MNGARAALSLAIIVLLAAVGNTCPTHACGEVQNAQQEVIDVDRALSHDDEVTRTKRLANVKGKISTGIEGEAGAEGKGKATGVLEHEGSAKGSAGGSFGLGLGLTGLQLQAKGDASGDVKSRTKAGGNVQGTGKVEGKSKGFIESLMSGGLIFPSLLGYAPNSIHDESLSRQRRFAHDFTDYYHTRQPNMKNTYSSNKAYRDLHRIWTKVNPFDVLNEYNPNGLNDISFDDKSWSNQLMDFVSEYNKPAEIGKHLQVVFDDGTLNLKKGIFDIQKFSPVPKSRLNDKKNNKHGLPPLDLTIEEPILPVFEEKDKILQVELPNENLNDLNDPVNDIDNNFADVNYGIIEEDIQPHEDINVEPTEQNFPYEMEPMSSRLGPYNLKTWQIDEIMKEVQPQLRYETLMKYAPEMLQMDPLYLQKFDDYIPEKSLYVKFKGNEPDLSNFVSRYLKNDHNQNYGFHY